MSRITTSCASLSWAITAIRRACSSGVRESSSPFGCGRSVAAVEAALSDQLGDPRRNQTVDRLTARDALTDVARRDGPRLDLEEQHAFGMGEPVERRVEAIARVSRTRCDAQTRELEDALRILPGREVTELVGADQEQRVAPTSRTQRVDRSRLLVELDVVVGKGGPCEVEPRAGVLDDVLVTGQRGYEHDEFLEPELPLGRLCERNVAVVRRVEGAAEQPDQTAPPGAAPLTPIPVPRRRSRPRRRSGFRRCVALPRAPSRRPVFRRRRGSRGRY